MNISVSSLPDDQRAKVAASLQSILLDLIALSLVAQRAHWNTQGPEFLQTHSLFGELYDAASSQIDTIAEYVSLLGAEVAGDHVEVVKGAAVQRVQGADGLQLCSSLFATTKAFLAKVDAAAREIGDLNAQQLLIDVSLGVGKPAWKIGKMVAKSS